MISLQINGKAQQLEADPSMPLLWGLRDLVGLTDTQYSCGISVCAACTVLVEGTPFRRFVTPVSAVAGKAITSIEGLSSDRRHPVQQAWLEEQVPQCDYCQSAQILSAAALLIHKPQPTDADIEAAMSGLTLEECPEFEVHIMPGTADPGGVGEPGTPPIAPAVANAVFAATGKPVRRLPIRLA